MTDIYKIPRQDLVKARLDIHPFRGMVSNLVGAQILKDLREQGANFVRKKYGEEITSPTTPVTALDSVGVPSRILDEREIENEKRNPRYNPLDPFSTHHPANIAIAMEPSSEDEPFYKERRKYFQEFIDICNRRSFFETGFEINLENLAGNPGKTDELFTDCQRLGDLYGFMAGNLYVPHTNHQDYTVWFDDKNVSGERFAKIKKAKTRAYNTLRDFLLERQDSVLRG